MKKWIVGLILTVAVLAGVFRFARPHSKTELADLPPSEQTSFSNKTVQAEAPARPVLSEPEVSLPPPVEKAQVVEEQRSVNDEARLKEIEKGVALGDIPEALRFLKSQSDSEEVRALTIALIRQWAEKEPRFAAEWVETMLSGGVKTEALNALAVVFAGQDLMEAIRWAWQLPEGDDRDGVIKQMGYEAAASDPVAALTLAVSSLPPVKERDDLITYASMQWAARDAEAAATWADQIQDVALRERALVNITTAWAETDPAGAAEFAVQKIAPGRAQDDAVIGIVQRWVQKDPEAAADWVETFPEGPLFETAAETIRQLWPADH